MAKINRNYLKLQDSYLFSTIRQKVDDYQRNNPEKKILRLGIGDVTLPLAPAVIEALHAAVQEQTDTNTFRGYAPELGYDFLRKVIHDIDFKARGAAVDEDEIIVSDGAKSDAANIQEIFSTDSIVAVGDPVYPVYVDSNIMAGRLDQFDEASGTWNNLIYLPANAENNFVPALPSTVPDLIYLCFPNNPTGTVLTKDELQKWVDYANENHSVIIFDAAYERYITDSAIPHSIYECDGARTCAIEMRSFSKSSGFTGLRLGYTVVPKDLIIDGVSLHKLWSRRQSSKFNGAPYIIQKAGEATYSPEGQKQVQAQVDYYMENARIIRDGLQAIGFDVFGGVNAPYIWLKTPNSMSSWDFFDLLLEQVQIVGTPGAGFGPSGEGYLRLSAFGQKETVLEAVERIKTLKI